MILRASFLALGASLALAALQPAAAHDLGDEIHGDVHAIQSDRHTVSTDTASLARESAELAAVRARERRDLNNGNLFGAIGAYRQAKVETRELAAANDKLRADRGKLQHDRRDLHEDVEHAHHWWN